MKLSVIIVNYNVKAYLDQCLRSVQEALKGMAGEVFVVDNMSTDGSVEMVRQRFPEVHLIANRENVGFSRANNQAIRECTGEYVLLLNPDTVVGEDVFEKVMTFMDAHPEAGGLGVKMIDGTGRFLPESKRGLPTPTVAFFKIMGLSRLFPKSRLFGRYHLGSLPENSTARIEILSGACMFLRKRTLDKVGLLDENFFMYGEDIDLSYRITLGGYENWYFPDARIIHYKGESTKKSSVNYVFVFYNAMAIFARKHFTRKGPQFFSLVIRGAIYLSAAAAIVVRFLRGALLPMIDVFLLLGGLYLLGRQEALPLGPSTVLRALSMVGVMAIFGAYDRPLHWTNLWKGIGALFLGLIALVLAGVLPTAEGARLLAVNAAVFLVVRFLLRLFRIGPKSSFAHRARVLAAGSKAEADRALALLWQTHFGLGKAATVQTASVNAVDGVGKMKAALDKQRVDEVVFCAKDLPMHRIIGMMEAMRSSGAIFKIAQPTSEFIIGPSTTESLQDLLVLRQHAVSNSGGRRRRRLLDVCIGLALLGLAPLLAWFIRSRAGFMRNLFQVLQGKCSWVGYALPTGDPRLPKLKPGILDIVASDGLPATPVVVRRMNLEYAKDYRPWKDLGRVARNFRKLGHTR